MGSLDDPSFSLPEFSTPWTETPLIHSTALSRATGSRIYLKLENVQPSGSFKSRGVGNFVLQKVIQNQHQRLHYHHQNGFGNLGRPAFYTVSGGNAGLACVGAASSLECAATVVVPLTTSPAMIKRLRLAGAADVIQTGVNLAEAERYLHQHLLQDTEHQSPQKQGEDGIPAFVGTEAQEPAIHQPKFYVPPFDHEDIWDGNAGIVRELPFKPDAIICSVGGGGLFVGVMQGLQERGWLGEVDVLAVETEGAASLAESLKHKQLVALDKITSLATSLGVSKVCQRAFDWARWDGAKVQNIVLSDKDAVNACLRFADEERMLLEPACGVNAAACYGGWLNKLVPGLKEDSKIVLIVCGGSNVTLDTIRQWQEMLEG